MGGASVHIKAFESTPVVTHQSQISAEGIGGPYQLSMLEEHCDSVLESSTYGRLHVRNFTLMALRASN